MTDFSKLSICYIQNFEIKMEDKLIRIIILLSREKLIPTKK